MAPVQEFRGFLSYAHADAKADPGFVDLFVEDLQTRVSAKLLGARLAIWRDIEKLKIGDRWDAEIAAALDASALLFVLLSPGWLQSDYCRKEFSVFRERIGGSKAITPILLRDVGGQAKWMTPEQKSVHDALTQIQHKRMLAADLLDLSAAQRTKLVDTLADEIVLVITGFRDAPEPQCATLSSRPRSVAIANVPIGVPRHFMGRDAALDAIQTAFDSDKGRVAITALHGLRGVGKTTLAAAYAERHAAAYRATWWIRAQTEATMRADLVALGVRLGWVAPDAKEEPALAAVMERLRHEGEGILLVFDNAMGVAELERHLPSGGAAQVLVTSNAPDWHKIADPISIEVWSKTAGADFLAARTGRKSERAAAKALSDALGGLPLAHEQAAAFCGRTGMGFAEYTNRFARAPVLALDHAKDAPAAYHGGVTVAKTFALAIEEAGKMHPAAEPLIVYAALLPPEPIPLYLFSEGRQHLGEPLATLLTDDGLDEAVAALRAFALIDREAIPDERDPSITTDTIRLHRLVRQVAAARCSAEANDDWHRALIEALNAVYPEGVFADPATWPRARRLDALAVAVLSAEVAIPAGAEEAAGRLLDRLASYRQSALAAYLDARSLFERALVIREATFGPDHSETASSLNDLAGLLRAQSDLVAARPLFERALAIFETALGPDHPDTASSLNNLALLHKAQGDLATARPLYERALTIREAALGPDHPHTAQGLNNLAVLLGEQGDIAGARPLHERALAIREAALGRDHPDTAQSLNNLAHLLQAQGELAEARSLFERALAIDEKVLGPDHPDTATCLNNLAVLLQAQGDLDGARALFDRALVIDEEVHGPDHPETAIDLANLAWLLHLRGDISGARTRLERALAIFEKSLGPDHPSTRITAGRMENVLYSLGEVEKAADVRARYRV